MDILTTLPLDSFVVQAFAELLEDVTNLLSAAQQQQPCDKAEVAFWRRQLNALNKAELHYRQGVRIVVADGAYLLPSASRPGALVHRLTRQGGILICSCEAGVKGTLCWHHQLACLVERAAELESRTQIEAEISGSGPDTTPEAAQQLFAQRLTESAAIIDAMRAAQGRSPLAFDPPVDIPDPTPGGPEPPECRPLGVRLAWARQTVWAVNWNSR